MQRATGRRGHEVNERERDRKRERTQANQLRPGPPLVVFVELLLRDLFGGGHVGWWYLRRETPIFKGAGVDAPAIGGVTARFDRID